MNRKQLIVMWAGIGIIMVMFLFPPWKYHFYFFIHESAGLNSIARTAQGPYNLIFFGAPSFPDDRVPYPKFRTLTGVLMSQSAELDWARLSIPIALVIILALGLIITLSNHKAS